MASGKSLIEVDDKKPKGFFPKLYEHVVKTMGDENLKKMETLADDTTSLIEFTYSLDNFKKSLNIRECFSEKNQHESKVKREYGNNSYKEGKDLDALYLYTQAVIAAPVDEVTQHGKDLALALANRSAVLFSLKAYNLALDDIRLALESGYPKELRYKLLERKAKILAFYKQHNDALSTAKQAINALDESKLERNKKLKVQQDLQQMINFYRKSPAVYNDINVQLRPKPEVPKLQHKNAKYPAISNAIEFRYQPGRGRFAVASRNIEVGEFICVERPLVSRILPEYSGSNCANCFLSMKAPLPCPISTNFLFCSYECRKTALETFLPLENRVIEFLVASGMSIICFLAFRAVTQKPLSYFLENKGKFVDHDETAGSDKNKVSKHLSDDYRNLYNLVTHHDERKYGDIFHRAMFAVMLLRCLKKFGYFGEERTDISPENDNLSEDELYIGTLLNHFLENLQFNSHEVAQFEMIARNREEGAESSFIGAAIYPTLALFNHSCDPSIVRFYVQDTVCVQAIKNITSGEEVCENYGPIFFHSNREDRQNRLLKQYWFECKCLPCTENWPMMHDMTDESLNFRCQDCDGSVKFNTASNNPLLRCVCGTPVPMLKALKQIGDTDMISEKAKKAMASGDLESAQNLYCDYLSTLDKYLVPPYPDYYKIQQSIWKCIWMRFGNRVIRSKMRKPAPVLDDYDTVD